MRHRAMRSEAMRRAVASAVMGAALAATATPASARICDLRVYDANFGQRTGESDTFFFSNAQFMVCFRAEKDGFVALWDRMPSDAPVERLAPNPNYNGVGQNAVQVKGGAETCFGSGADGYFLVMDPKDGDGLGHMWLTYSATDEEHPTEDSFGSVNKFAGAWEGGALGAGAMAATGTATAADASPAGPGGACEYKAFLDYDYRVEPAQ